MSDVPEADAQEQAEPVEPREDDAGRGVDPEAPEADALEQATPARPANPPRRRIPDDVPEADAIEQAETVPDPDVDER